MPRHREFGTIRQRGSRIEVRYTANGERHQKVLPVGSTKADAKLFLQRTELEVATGTWLQPSDTTLAELLDEWQLKHAPDIAPNTQRINRDRLGYLKEAIGGVKVVELTANHVETAKLSLLQRPRRRSRAKVCLSPKTVKDTLALGSQAMQWAMRMGLTNRNPFGLVTPPRRVKAAMRVWTVEEARRFLRACATEDKGVSNMLAMALWTGWRAESELGGLRWLDVDEELRTMCLSQVWLCKPGVLVPAGNSKHKPRTIRLTQEMLDILKRERAWQKRRKWAATRQEGYAWHETGLVFTSLYGQPMPEPMVVRAMTRLCAAAGVPRINAHGLRHTAASLAFSRGASVIEVQDMLGHSSAATTLNVYAHVVQHDGALTALAGALREEAQ